MSVVKASQNPILINESLMGKILKQTPKWTGKPIPRIVNGKTGEEVYGAEAKKMIDAIDDKRFIGFNKEIIDTGKEEREAKKKEKENKYRREPKHVVKTVSYKEVK